MFYKLFSRLGIMLALSLYLSCQCWADYCSNPPSDLNNYTPCEQDCLKLSLSCCTACGKLETDLKDDCAPICGDDLSGLYARCVYFCPAPQKGTPSN